MHGQQKFLDPRVSQSPIHCRWIELRIGGGVEAYVEN